MAIAGLINYSYFSRGQSILSPEQLVISTKDRGYSSIAVTELNTLISAPIFTELSLKHKLDLITGISLIVDCDNDESEELQNKIYLPITVLAKNKKGVNTLIELYNSIEPEGSIKSDSLKKLDLTNTSSMIGGDPYYIENALNTEDKEMIFSNLLTTLREQHTSPYLALDLYCYEHYFEELKLLADYLSVSLIFANACRYKDPDQFEAFSSLVNVFSKEKQLSKIVSHKYKQLISKKDKINLYQKSYQPSKEELDKINILHQEYITASSVVADECNGNYSQKSFYNVKPDEDTPPNKASQAILDKAYSYCETEGILASFSYPIITSTDNAYLAELSPNNFMFIQSGKSSEIIEILKKLHNDVILSYSATYSTLESEAVFSKTALLYNISEDRTKALYETINNKNNDSKSKITEQEQSALNAYELIKNCPLKFLPDTSNIYIFNTRNELILPYSKYRNAIDYVDLHLNDLSKSESIKITIRELNKYNLLEKIFEIRSNEESENIFRLNLSNEKLFRLINTNRVESIFILEDIKNVGKDYLRRVETIWDIAMLVISYRKHSQDKLDDFLYGKEQDYSKRFFNNRLTKILGISAGLIIYKEQILYLLNKFGKFNIETINELFSAVHKENTEVIEKLRNQFTLVCKDATDPDIQLLPETSDVIFNEIIKCIKSYPASLHYALTTAYMIYQSVYVKAEYPLYFYVSALNMNIRNKNTIQNLLDEIKHAQIELLPVDINKSEKEFTLNEDKVVIGLSALRNIDEEAISDIIRIRKEKGEINSISQFCSVINNKFLSKNMLEDLICAGAFDFTGYKRSAMFNAVKAIIKESKQKKVEKAGAQFNLFTGEKAKKIVFNDDNNIDKTTEEWDIGTIIRNEYEACGFFISEHPIVKYQSEAIKKGILSIEQTIERQNEDVAVLGMITNIEERTKKTGGKWCKVRIEDLKSSMEVLAFTRSYENVKNQLVEGAVKVFSGKLTEEDKPKMFLNAISDIKKTKTTKNKKKLNKNKEPKTGKQFDYESAKNIKDKENKTTSIFKIEMKNKLVDYDILMKIKAFLENHKGTNVVHFILSDPDDPKKTIEMRAESLKVSDSSNLEYKILNDFGDYVKRAWHE